MNLETNSTLEPTFNELTQLFKQELSDNLVGIYLHGSAAMNNFNPSSSDIDILVVAKESLSTDSKKKIGKALISISNNAPGAGLELSVITTSALHNFTYPTPFELHFSPDLLKDYENDRI